MFKLKRLRALQNNRRSYLILSKTAIFLILLLITTSSEFYLGLCEKEKTDQNITVDDDFDYGDDHDDRTIEMMLLDQSVTNIFEYSNIRIFSIQIFIRTFVRINFLDTNIFGYSFVSFS